MAGDHDAGGVHDRYQASSHQLTAKIEKLEEDIKIFRVLVDDLIRDRERYKRGREPTDEELMQALLELRDKTPDRLWDDTDYRLQLSKKEDEIAALRQQILILQQTAAMTGGTDVDDIRWEALRSRALTADNEKHFLESALAEAQHEIKLLLQRADGWEEAEAQYVTRINDLSAALDRERKTVGSKADRARIELIKKNTDEVGALRRKLDEYKAKIESQQRQMAVDAQRLEAKDRNAEQAYQKMLEYQELQRVQLSDQLTWVIDQQKKERAEFEQELAVKAKELQALETRCTVRESCSQRDEPSNALQELKQQTEVKLRNELDRVRLLLEHQKHENAFKIREVEQKLAKHQAELVNVEAKCERLDKVAHERHVKLGQYQDRITEVQAELRKREAELECELSQVTERLASSAEEHRRTEQTLQNEMRLAQEAQRDTRHQAEMDCARKQDEIQQKDILCQELRRRLDAYTARSDRAAEEAKREKQQLRTCNDELEAKVAALRQEKISLDDDVARSLEKQARLEYELRITTDQTTVLVDRDAKLVAENQAIKVHYHQVKLELQRTERHRQRLGVQVQELKRRLSVLSSSNPSNAVLAICGKSGHRSRKTKRSAYHVDELDLNIPSTSEPYLHSQSMQDIPPVSVHSSHSDSEDDA
ncbi:Flagellar attachment zone protein 1 [Diplonema papillatum]|nr:Flagellar attachment zone protein 1 [Diplonema papillatum]